MASGDDEIAELRKCFEDFVKVSSAGKPTDCKKMTSKACGKMVKDTLPKEVYQRADASVFPKYKTKGQQYMEVDHFLDFIKDCAHEYQKIKTKNDKLPKDDPKVLECEKDFRQRICKGRPVITGVKESKTGGVDRLTDTTKYTGSHKERFDDKGQGKGISGRENLHANDGYVGQYKGKDTYGTKK